MTLAAVRSVGNGCDGAGSSMCVDDWQSQIRAVYYRQRGDAVARQDTLMKALASSLSGGAKEHPLKGWNETRKL